jgi:hypothetical protein
MEFKVRDLLMVRPSLEALLNARLKSVRAAYRISKLMKKVIKELDDFEEARSRFVTDHGTKDAEGRYQIEKTSPEFDKFVAAMDALMNETVEIQVMKVSLKDLEGAALTAAEIINLDFLIQDEDRETIN